ncbi:MAG: DUF262 domain-containing protein [Proteobacteria bacterium]|nr:DUF262 domain-containing protein [Pseudomonadota bacterium]
MQVNKKAWPLLSICGLKQRIDTQPDYQRPAVWDSAQRQLLIDTILRGYDVPKLYWRKVASAPDKYEVVDGQQRIRTVWEVHAGEFGLSKSNDPIEGLDVRNLHYEELPEDLRLRFDTYNMDVVILSDTDEDEVREMFLRLQNGTTLKAQEKRNAMPGKMRDFVKKLAEHKIFANSGFSNSRYTFDLVAAQMVLVELAGGPANAKNADLNRMYKDNQEFDVAGEKAKKVRRVLEYLLSAFPSKTPELERFSLLSLYMLTSHMLDRYAFQGRQNDLAQWFIKFEILRRAEEKKPVDQMADPDLVIYHEKTSHSTDAKDSLEWRHQFLLRNFLESCPDLELKDDQRLFTHDQRMAIYRRDDGICRVRLKCDGAKCNWDSWEADHIKPWAKGGRTTVANGQVACLACNPAKSDAA